MRNLKGSRSCCCNCCSRGSGGTIQDLDMIHLKSILRLLETYLLSAFILASLLAGPLIILFVR
ncbi:hypothetical protein AMC82_CH02615 [Rhizobium phaseoli]|uniref:Uncharacterized protein n=1 Tax=Rhizobium phaseoli TaxID=396 RepID=A0ABM6CB16_9HYPH|nr:hypothetical protein AMC88_CH02673 [Rhizobium phaseoli]KKZ85859.1 hypothetical protein RPHASCH2410_CH19210 [Rhizobium phaseoli Ch24-10]ANL53785.1 hypothetical protein AMC86_CH02658 [Rhizobium phaseoli]ANL60038.1 hypothetical protein AMC85_CH02672 [Rhizobium phaseoli]ANL66251.1 hypothetical protein AMC84_CH02625 [Rhizobium phaseoli]